MLDWWSRENYFVRGRITKHLVSSLTRLDSIKHDNQLFLYMFKLRRTERKSVFRSSDTSPYCECSLHDISCWCELVSNIFFSIISFSKLQNLRSGQIRANREWRKRIFEKSKFDVLIFCRNQADGHESQQCLEGLASLFKKKLACFLLN